MSLTMCVCVCVCAIIPITITWFASNHVVHLQLTRRILMRAQSPFLLALPTDCWPCFPHSCATPYPYLAVQSGFQNPESVSVNHGQENWQSKPQPVINVRNQADASYSYPPPVNTTEHPAEPVATIQAQQKPIRTTNAYAGTERNSFCKWVAGSEQKGNFTFQEGPWYCHCESNIQYYIEIFNIYCILSLMQCKYWNPNTTFTMYR